MEKKIGKNVSSGAEKVERVEKEGGFTAETANASRPAAEKSAKTPKSTRKAKRSPSRPSAAKKAEHAEKAAAKKRADRAKQDAAKKEARLMKKAELKQKKMEKRAELKQKKLEKRAEIVRKREERKQKKLEKRAALKEKRLERRAERIARREMLKNETKTEREKRIAREKREKIALRRQRREANERARAQKIRSREAAHARKAQDRKNKREHKTRRKERSRGFGGWLAAVISLGVACLALATVVTAGSFRMNDMAVEAENGARATLYEMVSASEDMDGNLAKLRVSSGANEQRKLLTEVLVDTALMENALERIPVDAATGTDISAFVNRTGSYARMLLARLAAGKEITESERETVAALYEINSQLCAELNDLATHLSSDEMRAFMNGNSQSMTERFGEMGRGTRIDPQEIVDAPFSGRGNVGENRLAELEEISPARAEELAKQYFNGYHLRDVRYTGETTARDMTCYNFVMTDENGAELFAEITKNGGKLAFFDTYEPCSQKNFDLETCDAIAREYLADLGIGPVEAVWLSDGGMVANLTYVGCEDGLRAYPDMIRIRVCEQKGRVIGMDAKGYLLNHSERSASAALSEEEAASFLSSHLDVESSHLALIPAAGGERVCYEFLCRYGEEEYVVYVDADTGEEVQLFRVRQSARGSYLE